MILSSALKKTMNSLYLIIGEESLIKRETKRAYRQDLIGGDSRDRGRKIPITIVYGY